MSGTSSLRRPGVAASSAAIAACPAPGETIRMAGCARYAATSAQASRTVRAFLPNARVLLVRRISE